VRKKNAGCFGDMSALRGNGGLNLVQPAKQDYLYYSIFSKFEASGSRKPLKP